MITLSSLSLYRPYFHKVSIKPIISRLPKIPFTNRSYSLGKKNISHLKINTVPSTFPLLSFREIQHSMKFLSFFSHYTKSLYECSDYQFLKDLLPIILTAQGLVYSADMSIEEAQKQGFSDIELPWLKQKKILMQILKDQNLYSIEAEKEADNLTEYWHLENALMAGAPLTKEKLEKAILLRASDVMMLHRICEKKLALKFPFTLWAALQDIEALRDIEADLRQYEEDVKNNDFNIYRMFTKFYGTHAENFIHFNRKLLIKSYLEKLEEMPSPFKFKLLNLLESYLEKRPLMMIPKTIE